MTATDLRRLAAGTLLASFAGTEAPKWILDGLDGGLGGVVLFSGNIAGPVQLRRLTDRLHGVGEAVVALDEEGGDVTRLEATTGCSWPGNAALGAADDVELTTAVARAMGATLAAVGVDLNLAPCVDVNVEPANPVIGVRSFGADPSLAARHAAAFVTGLQAAGVVACAKHFPGHGDTRVDSHLGLPVVDVDAATLRVRELVPFRAAIAAGTGAIMSAHLVVPAIDDRPATLSRRLLTNVLRGELGFTGVVITDALDMAALAATYAIPGASVRALAAGADLLCLGPGVDREGVAAVADAITAAVGDGSLAESRLLDAHRRAATLHRAGRAPAISAGKEERSLGLHAAQRALRILRPLPGPVAGAHVVELSPPAGIAAGRVPWGVGGPLARFDPTTTVSRVGPDDDVGVELVRAEGRPLVVVGRDVHRHPWQRDRVAQLGAARPDLILVEMGWPAPAGDGPPAHVWTYGASAVAGEAAADVLRGAAGPRHG